MFVAAFGPSLLLMTNPLLLNEVTEASASRTGHALDEGPAITIADVAL
jgi:hypothetical protein